MTGSQTMPVLEMKRPGPSTTAPTRIGAPIPCAARLITAAGGGTLGLFTAIARLKAVQARIADRLAREGLPLYAQHVDPIDTGTLTDIFRDDPHASLLGTDALRYTLARYPADSPIDVDPELLRAKTNDNPVFYVQYAHARACNAARNAHAHGVERTGEDGAGFDAGLLSHEREEELLAHLAKFPTIVARSAELREPHRVARYLEELAAAYHAWYAKCRIAPSVSESGETEPVTDLNRSRLWLNDATVQVLRNGLALLGVDAPEKM